MPELTSKAAFLSYASQDAEAAMRICDSLRALRAEFGRLNDYGSGGAEAPMPKSLGPRRASPHAP